jgi:hypothetical protein
MAVRDSLLLSIKRRDLKSFLTLTPGLRADLEKAMKAEQLMKLHSMGHLLLRRYG